MERSLETESGILRYRCERKRVKNINVRIDREGQVLVSYPAGCPLSTVEAFLRQKSRWIARAQERMARRAVQAQQPRHVQTGERVELLGKPYTLRICQALPPVASEPDGPGLAWEGILFLKVESRAGGEPQGRLRPLCGLLQRPGLCRCQRPGGPPLCPPGGAPGRGAGAADDRPLGHLPHPKRADHPQQIPPPPAPPMPLWGAGTRVRPLSLPRPRGAILGPGAPPRPSKSPDRGAAAGLLAPLLGALPLVKTFAQIAQIPCSRPGQSAENGGSGCAGKTDVLPCR